MREFIEQLRQLGYDNIYKWCDSPGTYYDWHYHYYDEVRLILEGSITIGTEDKVYHLKAGDLLEVPAGKKHWAKTEEGVCYLCGTKK